MEPLGFAGSWGWTPGERRSDVGRGGFLGTQGRREEGCAGVAHGAALRRENAENMYYFSELALTLNEHEEGVAPTDSRLRPDQRLMEKGNWDEANTEKQRLEEKQRMSRRRRLEACSRGCGAEDEKEADVYIPLWFEKRLDPLTGETACMYKGGYWEAKEKQDWHMCPNIF